MPAVSKKQQRYFGYLLSNPEERKKKGISKILHKMSNLADVHIYVSRLCDGIVKNPEYSIPAVKRAIKHGFNVEPLVDEENPGRTGVYRTLKMLYEYSP